MSSWNHDRDYYAKLARVLGKWAILCFAMLLISIVLLIIESVKFFFYISTVVLFGLFILLLRLRVQARHKYHRAPSRL